jgi:diguanylate cyclase (GGDEF)-like protein
VLPATPLPLTAGDEPDGLALLLRFPAGSADGELWAPPVALGGPVRDELLAQFHRVWAVYNERTRHQGEMDGLRFHLAALQQVTHTLAEVRETGETEQLALDFIREICFAWWAALYRTDDTGAYRLRVRYAARGERLAEEIAAEVVQPLFVAADRPVIPGADDPIRAFLPDDVSVLVPFQLGDAGSGLLALGSRLTSTPYTPQDLTLLQTLVDASAIALRNTELIGFLRTQAIRDALTGCQNRRGYDEILTIEYSRARRYKRTLCLVTLDLDHFKSINDVYGHEAGDHALRRVGKLLLTSFRATDTVCRPGGEEFALIFPETPKVEAVRLAERLRIAIEEMPVDGALPKSFTASFGVAAYPDDADSIDELVRVADRALYEAKAAGRNRVVVAGGTPVPGFDGQHD